uniref:amyloid beta A4 precursor protein-binding family B member 2-like isoform X2 n=1 Tax=Monopterus albus TaxID=43700 RepID=UPI0009B48049|nr:amyloid beta A4 precursor protein-binding family B member 2-like isoform X2 [Monopterus albus]XP_020480087.1 amyloid beta A4 precursor protein-binding family B member 2-like isoform X2 [Monopterus albus]
MMSVQTPPLSRSGSSPSNVGLANRSSSSATPPTSLSLRSSYNQLLGRDVIKGSMETGSSATLPKSRQRYAMTTVRSAMGISDNWTLSSKIQPVSRGRGLPTKSSSSSALYTSSSSSSLFNTTNPKLAKNGANMQRRAESQQLELSRANTEGKIHNDLRNNPTSDWLELEKDNSQQPPFRRRTKSFLEYHGKGWDLDFNWGKKEDKEEKKQQPSPEKEQASPAKERDSQKEEKPSTKQACQEEKDEVEPVVEEEEEEEEDDPTPTPRQPLLPVVVEAPLSSTSSSSTNSPEWVPESHNSLQNQAPAQGREALCVQLQASPRSPAKPPRSSQPRVIKVELHPNNENQFLQQYPPSSPKQARASERNTPTRSWEPPALPGSEQEIGLPKVGFRMDLTPDTPSEDEDSSWTTLSQETPSPQTPQETDCLIWKCTKKPLLKQASHSSNTAGTFKAPVSHLMAQRVIRMDRRIGYCR